MVKTPPSKAAGAGLVPGQGAEIPHALWPKHGKQKQYCKEFNKDFKLVHKKQTRESAGVPWPWVCPWPLPPGPWPWAPGRAELGLSGVEALGRGVPSPLQRQDRPNVG